MGGAVLAGGLEVTFNCHFTGGSAILTPEQFMENVQQLDSKE